MKELTTTSENRDVQSITNLCNEIGNADWHYGPLETKLELIVVLAERLERDKGPVFPRGHLSEGN